MNTQTISQAIQSHPVFQTGIGDVGHAGVRQALAEFLTAWGSEYRLRDSAASGSGQMLRTAATDTERVDQLLAQAAAGIGQGGRE